MIMITFLYRKQLNKGGLLYIHLNLVIALLVALIIFVAGIGNATPVSVSSVFFFFLSDFEKLLNI